MRLKIAKERTILTLSILWAFARGQAAPIGGDEILGVATNFLGKPFFGPGTRVAALEPPTAGSPFWRAELAPRGFLLLTAESGARVLAFSSTSGLAPNGKPAGPLEDWLRSYRPAQGVSPMDSNRPSVRKQQAAELPASSKVLVAPMLGTHWSQWAPFNQDCPAVTNGMAGYDGRTPVGCVPVAMGQLLRFYSWPAAGTGEDLHEDVWGDSTGSYSAVWTNALPWNDLKDSFAFGCAESPELVAPLAELMAKLGASAEMDYEAEGSSSDILVLARKLRDHLGYSLGAFVQSNELSFPVVLEQEILARRPVLVNVNTFNGHTLLADGLAEDGETRYVHLNFGWGGQDDGWYTGYDVGTNAPTLFSSLVAGVRPAGESGFLTCLPNFVDFTATNGMVSTQALDIFVTGTNTIAYTLAASEPWLTVTPTNGAASADGLRHEISFDLSQVPAGVLDAHIRVEGNAPNLPRLVRVRVYKPELPQINQQPADILTAFPTNQVMSVTAVVGDSHTPCGWNEPLRYQWFFNGEPIPDTPYTWCYTLGYGTYECEVSGMGGSVRTRAAVVKPEERGSRLKVAQRNGTKFLLQISNVQSGQATLETSTDLVKWTTIQSFPLAPTQTAGLWIEMSQRDSRRFYRIRE